MCVSTNILYLTGRDQNLTQTLKIFTLRFGDILATFAISSSLNFKKNFFLPFSIHPSVHDAGSSLLIFSENEKKEMVPRSAWNASNGYANRVS